MSEERRRFWYERHDNVAAVAHYLVEEEGWTAEQLLGFLDKPWNWSEKWEELQAKWLAERLMKR